MSFVPLNTGQSVTPSALPPGTTVDYAPTGLHHLSVLRQASDASGSVITSFLVPVTDGFTFYIDNLGPGTLTLSNESGFGTSAYRMTAPSSIDVVLPVGGQACLRYDATTQRYRFLGISWSPSVAPSTLTVPHLNVTQNASDIAAPEQDFIARNADWVQGIDVANTPPARDFVIAGQRGSYSFEDAVTNGTTTLTSAAQGGFDQSLVGASISGTNIQAGATVSAVGGATSLTMSKAATGSGTNRATITRNTTADIIYLKHRGSLAPTVGVGVTPPDGSARLQVAGSDTENALETARFRVGPSQTGNGLVVHDSNPTERWWIDSAFYMSGVHPLSGGAVCVQADPTNARPLVVCDNAKAAFYGFQFSGSNLNFRYVTGGINVFQVGTDGSVEFINKIGFQGSAPISKPTVTGSKGANAALASLLTALASYGLITDSST